MGQQQHPQQQKLEIEETIKINTLSLSFCLPPASMMIYAIAR
jgi:hypothetical protein